MKINGILKVLLQLGFDMSSSDLMFVKPLTITDAMLTSSAVPETVAATYSGATAYVVGDRVGLAPSVTGAAQLIYECIQNGTGQPLPVPPATATAYWRYVGSVYPVYSAGNTYVLGGIVSNITTNVHELYESLVAGNIGNTLTDATKWLNLGSTNRWKMFDAIAASQTTNAESIVNVITPGVLINSAVFGNLSGLSIRVQQSISGYDRTIELNSHIVADWYGWFYEPLITRDEAAFTDIPPYAAGVLTVTIANAGGTAACGVGVIGMSSYLGIAKELPVRGINDYSRITEDAWGGLVLTVGNYSKTMSIEFFVPAGYESQAIHLLTGIRATPVMFVCGDVFDSGTIYGILGRNWSVPMSVTGGLARLEIRGLV